MSSVSSLTENRIFLDNLRWPTYLALLEDLGEHRGRLTFERGRLEIVSPSNRHEHLKGLLGRFIEVFTEELGIKILTSGATTLNRADLQRGVEADESYYVANEPAVRGKDRIDLSQDPPPDLVIEIEVSRRLLDRMSIYAALGIPEVWRYDGSALRVSQLEPGGEYRETGRSASFPMLPIPELERFLAERVRVDETELVRSFRRWVRERFTRG